jgi:hypothetical protein
MAGGISAIKGFDYQATVILHVLLDFFDQYGSAARVRPEGLDDLDLLWTADSEACRRYVQIKKPREDDLGNLKLAPWTLTQAIGDLFPNTIFHLTGNDDEQLWIVGDSVDVALASLISDGANAPVTSTKQHCRVVHTLARQRIVDTVKLDAQVHQKLLRWRAPDCPPGDPTAALAEMINGFQAITRSAGLGETLVELYKQETNRLHACLPSIISRIEILSMFGTEEVVATRVNDRLQQRYGLDRLVIEDNLFRNLRGFINDISKQPGRTFNHEEFELELRCVWPQMIAVREAPPLEQSHISRRDLIERLTTQWTGNALDVVGISGSGKTSLASEVAALSPRRQPDRSVFYAEATSYDRLRHVLVGIAFHLRRFQINGPFATAVAPDLTDEDVVARLARLYSTMQRNILILIDLTEGRCSPAFARDLATFVRNLSPTGCRLAVFGQESGLRELSQLERDQFGVTRLDIRGFRFEEFVALASRYHPNPNNGVLFEIYQRATAGRAAGLFARLAQSLARAASLQEMSEMAARPADDILAFAEQQRFAQISTGSRSGAEKLVCFALPFTRKDAEEIFPQDNIGGAIYEMRTLGLLRPHDTDSFEMHETVRAGLEGTIALGVRRAAHEALALWYRSHGAATAEILHLDKAGEHQEACERAREAFLQGKRWAALAAYVREHKLVSVEDVIRTVTAPEPIEDRYLLSRILRGLQGSVRVDELVDVVRAQPDRFHADYTWGLAILEAILEFEPQRLFDLVMWETEATSDHSQLESNLGLVMVAARRKRSLLEPASVELFNRQQPERKRLLLPFMLLDWRSDVLRPAFAFIVSDQEAGEGRDRAPFWQQLVLRVDSLEDTVEFLAALPTVEPAAMLNARSVLLGAFSDPVWAQRMKLRAHCIHILTNYSIHPESVLLVSVREQIESLESVSGLP